MTKHHATPAPDGLLALWLPANGGITTVTLPSNPDERSDTLARLVDGMLDVVALDEHTDMWVNDEFLFRWPETPNVMATRVAGAYGYDVQPLPRPGRTDRGRRRPRRHPRASTTPAPRCSPRSPSTAPPKARSASTRSTPTASGRWTPAATATAPEHAIPRVPRTRRVSQRAAAGASALAEEPVVGHSVRTTHPRRELAGEEPAIVLERVVLEATSEALSELRHEVLAPGR